MIEKGGTLEKNKKKKKKQKKKKTKKEEPDGKDKIKWGVNNTDWERRK